MVAPYMKNQTKLSNIPYFPNNHFLQDKCSKAYAYSRVGQFYEFLNFTIAQLQNKHKNVRELFNFFYIFS